MTPFLNWLDDLTTKIHQLICRHTDWIPAIYGRGAAKLCADCGKRVDMADNDFYAEFGNTLNHVLAIRHR